MDREILIKSLRGRLEEEERKKVEEWLKASEEHRTYYGRLRRLMIARRKEKVDVGKNYNEFLRRTGRMRRRRFVRRMGYAAAVAVVLLGGVFVWMQRMSDEKLGYSKNILVENADNMVVLKVGEQKVLVMDGSEEQEVLSEKGVVVRQNHATVDYSVKTDSLEVEPVPHMLKVPHGGEFELSLEDGSRVWINSETQVEYMVPFAGEERRVRLKGEAYFQIAKGDKPFVVEFDGMEVKVLGTEFNVKAYGGMEDFATTLVEGKIEFQKGDSSWILHPNEQICMKDGQLCVHEVDVEKYIAWKDGIFAFSNERLEDIMKKLARWYDIEVFYQNPDTKDVRFTGSIDRYVDVRLLLEKLEKMQIVDFSMAGNTITIKWKTK